MAELARTRPTGEVARTFGVSLQAVRMAKEEYAGV